MSMSDRIVVMTKGRVEQVATPAEIYFRPATIFVADFIGRANFIEVVPEQVAGEQSVVTALGERLRVAAHPAVRANSPAYLMIRPETISLKPTGDGGIGAVLRSTFHGHSVDYEVETISGTLHVTDSGPDPNALIDVGTNVAITLNPDRCYVLNDN